MRALRLEEAQKFVGGWVELLTVEYRFRPWSMLVNEDGKILKAKPPVNKVASDIAGVMIVGNALMIDGSISP